jgi:Oxidoreductase family, NAD-binding Rossmann fold
MTQVWRGLLSTAGIGRVVLDATRDTARTRFVAVASRDGDRAREFAEACGLQSSFGSYEELLASDDIDAVYVALAACVHRLVEHQGRRHTRSGAPASSRLPSRQRAGSCRGRPSVFQRTGEEGTCCLRPLG